MAVAVLLAGCLPSVARAALAQHPGYGLAAGAALHPHGEVGWVWAPNSEASWLQADAARLPLCPFPLCVVGFCPGKR